MRSDRGGGAGTSGGRVAKLVGLGDGHVGRAQLAAGRGGTCKSEQTSTIIFFWISNFNFLGTMTEIVLYYREMLHYTCKFNTTYVQNETIQ